MVSPQMQGLLTQTIRLLKRRGVDYAEVRWVEETHEELVVQNVQVQHVSLSTTEGVSIRVLYRGAWGYASSCRLDGAGLKHTAEKAIEMAKAVALDLRHKAKFPPMPPAKGYYETPLEVDPFHVETQKKLDYLLWACQILKDHPNIKTATALLDFYRIHKLFVSTEGSFIEQRIIESGGTLEAAAALDHEVQRRSFPSSNDACLAQAGYEYVKALDFVGEAARVRKEAVALLRAKECPSGPATLILMPDQLVLQLHESCGHPAELDRALGLELSFAGGSFLTPDQLGKLRYGNKRVNITADATVPRGCGTFGFDDEGVPAQRAPLVKEGLFVGYLSSRESAAAIGRKSSGAMRANGWNAVPIVRMTNVNLEPGEGTLDDLVRDTKKGVLMATNKSWSIDDRRLNFQFGTEIAWEVRNGKVGQILKNPVYTGITPEFWGSCSGIAGKEEWRLFGLANCAKGEPMQVMHVGHGASPARFEKVQVGRNAAR